MPIPSSFHGIALSAVAGREPKVLASTAHQLGMSASALAREALRLADDPAMAAQYPRQVRAVRERRDRMREARSARLLTVRCEV